MPFRRPSAKCRRSLSIHLPILLAELQHPTTPEYFSIELTQLNDRCRHFSLLIGLSIKTNQSNVNFAR